MAHNTKMGDIKIGRLICRKDEVVYYETVGVYDVLKPLVEDIKFNDGQVVLELIQNPTCEDLCAAILLEKKGITVIKATLKISVDFENREEVKNFTLQSMFGDYSEKEQRLIDQLLHSDVRIQLIRRKLKGTA